MSLISLDWGATWSHYYGGRCGECRVDVIRPSEVRYIKLGAQGKWAAGSIERGELEFGHRSVFHRLCQSGDWNAVEKAFLAEGRTPGKAKDFTRELRDFYTLDDNCLWITFADRKLWWTFANPSVTWIGGEEGSPSRIRQTIGGWRSESVLGVPLSMETLSTRLTQTATYRQTICKVHDAEYLVRKINGVPEPLLAEALAAKESVTKVTMKMIERLHWADFEILVDLIFARSGWQRISRVGGSQKDVDIVLEQPSIGERAFVQIKSKAGRDTLKESLAEFHESGMDRFYFVCHSPRAVLQLPPERGLHLWTGEALANSVVEAGLLNWLMEAIA